MSRENRLPTKLEAFQNQCFDDKGGYTGFQCPSGRPNCVIRVKTQGLDMDEAVRRHGGLMEMDHRDGRQRFSQSHTTLPEQVTIRCEACHTKRHGNDSCTRLPRR